jgi:ATP-dependent Clp protease ATP-binding subunit ClpC
VQAGPDSPDRTSELEFARRVAAMYESWARQRGMRIAVLKPTSRYSGDTVWLAVSGFSSFVSLAPEDGLHVLEWGTPADGGVKRASVRVRVLPQPLTPMREGDVELTRQAAEVLGSAPSPPPTIVRRYRGTPSPLVRDSVRGWRTGRLERVFAGDFDLVPAGEVEKAAERRFVARHRCNLATPDASTTRTPVRHLDRPGRRIAFHVLRWLE